MPVDTRTFLGQPMEKFSRYAHAVDVDFESSIAIAKKVISQVTVEGEDIVVSRLVNAFGFSRKDAEAIAYLAYVDIGYTFKSLNT